MFDRAAAKVEGLFDVDGAVLLHRAARHGACINPARVISAAVLALLPAGGCPLEEGWKG